MFDLLHHGDVKPRFSAPRPTVGEAIFAFENFDDFYEEGKVLYERHWQEVAKDKHLMKLDIDEDYYRNAGRQGGMRFVTVRVAGTLVGYVWWLIYRHPHYRTIWCAQGDVHFLAPEYRKGLNGYTMLKRAIQLVKTLGVQYCYIREKMGHEHPAVLKRLGFAPLDKTYSCDLTKGRWQ